MRHTTVTALLAAAVLALAGCSSSDGGKPAKATATVTKTPKLDASEQRKACVDAWAKALDADDADPDQEPAACSGLPEGDRIDRYMEGLQQRNKAHRDAFDACTDDPSSCPTEP